MDKAIAGMVEHLRLLGCGCSDVPREDSRTVMYYFDGLVIASRHFPNCGFLERERRRRNAALN